MNIGKDLKLMLIGFFVGMMVLFLIFNGASILEKVNNEYFFDTTNIDEQIENNYNNNVTKIEENYSKPYSTVIVYDNTYSGINVKNKKEAKEVIVKDSVMQKDNCPEEILEIENEFINKYNITAVNFCELDINYLKELQKVYDEIYNEYSSVKNYLTNTTIMNTKESENYIAAFMPVFNFTTANTRSTQPWIIKTQILLNAEYFLNYKRLTNAVNDSVRTSHFPKNATTTSPVAHELGHYLSFVAHLKKYELNSILIIDYKNVNKFYLAYDDYAKGTFSKEMLEEAYNNYLNDYHIDVDFDDFRDSISSYATAKDNNGEYIYDETIAEAFHDVYLNHDNVSIASKYVIAVLKRKLGDL